MDKEAQEKIASTILHCQHIPLYSAPNDMAKAILDELGQLGYRKPLDRPELREKIARKFWAKWAQYCGKTWDDIGIDLQNEWLAWIDVEILALIPDIPKDKPPLPTPDEIKEWIGKSFSHLNPEYTSYFYMGIEALYTHLGGKKFLEVRSPKGSRY